MSTATRIGVTELEHLGGTVLEAAGLSRIDAADSTRILVEAKMLGLATHGVIRLPTYVARMAGGGIDSRAAVQRLCCTATHHSRSISSAAIFRTA